MKVSAVKLSALIHLHPKMQVVVCGLFISQCMCGLFLHVRYHNVCVVCDTRRGAGQHTFRSFAIYNMHLLVKGLMFPG